MTSDYIKLAIRYSQSNDRYYQVSCFRRVPFPRDSIWRPIIPNEVKTPISVVVAIAKPPLPDGCVGVIVVVRNALVATPGDQETLAVHQGVDVETRPVRRSVGCFCSGEMVLKERDGGVLDCGIVGRGFDWGEMQSAPHLSVRDVSELLDVEE